jgi:hypothetical protein
MVPPHGLAKILRQQGNCLLSGKHNKILVRQEVVLLDQMKTGSFSLADQFLLLPVGRAFAID